MITALTQIFVIDCSFIAALSQGERDLGSKRQSLHPLSPWERVVKNKINNKKKLGEGV
jgi:hypothetical protein